MADVPLKICVVGLGYIGLPTAALLASSGYNVHGVDVSERAVTAINQGKIHIDEPDLDSFVTAAVGRGLLKAALTPETADVFILCVPTPFHPSENPNDPPKPNVDYVVSAAKSIAPYVKAGDMVILESTSPVGTTLLVQATLEEAGVDVSTVSIAYCPERVLPGKIMTELVQNDRIIGGVTKEATERVQRFYETFVKGTVLGTNCKTAEMAKLVENSFRDVNIAFANELSMLCEAEDINVWELIELANRHPRVKILQPGAGVGGHCIAVDPWFLVDMNPGTARLIRTAREVNDGKQRWVVEQILKASQTFETQTGRKPIIGCLGLAFKPDIADLRESPALEIVKELLDLGLNAVAVEPNIDEHKSIPLVQLGEALESSDMIVILVKHRHFREFNAEGKLVLDYCGLLAG